MLDVIFETLQIVMLLILGLGLVWVLGEVLRESIRSSLSPGRPNLRRPDRAAPIIVPESAEEDADALPPLHTLPRPRRVHERHR